jgi:hypothetical protein
MLVLCFYLDKFKKKPPAPVTEIPSVPEPKPKPVPRYIKQSDMPVTNASLKEPVIPLAHSPCQLCCRVATTFQCTGCFAVSYCSEEHQSQHWPAHSRACVPLLFVRKAGDEELGIPPHFVAGRNIASNTLLYKTKPTMLAPCGRGSQPDSDLCLGCCSWFPLSSDFNSCRNCDWPLCSERCEKVRFYFWTRQSKV